MTQPAPVYRNLINTESISRHWTLGNRAGRRQNYHRWIVALPSFRAVGRRDGKTQLIADTIREANNKIRPVEEGGESSTDIVERLARAYKYFLKLFSIHFI